jgi:DNA replication factor GINS
LFGDSRVVEETLERREREYLFAKTRATMRSSLEDIDAGDFKIESLKSGETVELPRWVAEELVRLNVAEVPEDAFETEILKSLSREKMMGPLQLSNLQQDFYIRMRRRMQQVAANVDGGKARREEYEKLKAASYDLIGMRLSKLLSLSSSSTTVSVLGEKLTPEEREFFGVAQSLSKEWKGALLGNGF